MTTRSIPKCAKCGKSYRRSISDMRETYTSQCSCKATSAPSRQPTPPTAAAAPVVRSAPPGTPPIPPELQAEIDAEIQRERAAAIAELRGRPVRNYTADNVGELCGRTWADLAYTAVREASKPVGDPATNVRSWLSIGGLSELDAIVGASILRGTQTTPPTCDGFCRRGSLANFRATPLGRISTAARLEKLARGESAQGVGIDVAAEQIALARYAASFAMDEIDLEGNQPVDWSLEALLEIGAAAGRLLPDLVFALLLENAAMADGTPVFDASRGNLSAAVLADTSLDAGLSAIASQTHTSGDGAVVHRNLTARYLIVAPPLLGLAKRLVVDMGENLEVLAESRLSAAGVVDPRDQSVLRTGYDTAWMLACDQEQAPSVALGALNGRFDPTINATELARGQWGREWSIKLDLGCAVVDSSPMYFSSGVGP